MSIALGTKSNLNTFRAKNTILFFGTKHIFVQGAASEYQTVRKDGERAKDTLPSALVCRGTSACAVPSGASARQVAAARRFGSVSVSGTPAHR